MKKKIIIIVCILIFCSGCESHADKTTNTNSNQKNNKDVIDMILNLKLIFLLKNNNNISEIVNIPEYTLGSGKISLANTVLLTPVT